MYLTSHHVSSLQVGLQKLGDVLRKELAHQVVLGLDEPVQELRGEQVGVLLQKHLGQHTLGDIFLGLGVDHLHLIAIPDQGDHLIQRQVLAVSDVVQPAVGVFLDEDRF